MRSAPDYGVSLTPSNCPIPFCSTPVYPFDRIVTLLCETQQSLVREKGIITPLKIAAGLFLLLWPAIAGQIKFHCADCGIITVWTKAS